MNRFLLSCLLSGGFCLNNSMTNANQNSAKQVQSADDCRWPMLQMQVPEAWNVLAQSGKSKPGFGITIAHLDTGIIPLNSILFTNKVSAGSLGVQLPSMSSQVPGFNFVQPELSPLDNDPKALSFGHGTSTASLFVGWLSASENQPFEFRGLAPWIKLFPIKVTDSVVMVGNMSTRGTADLRNLAKGIELATKLKAHVISISLGAMFDAEGLIQKSVENAIENGAIVVAAGGQTFPVGLIPLPARLPSVVAVSASTREKMPWSEAFTGRHIDWSVPGADICHVRAGLVSGLPEFPIDIDSIVRISGRRGDELKFTDGLIISSGTSFSTAFTAAAAALWLQFHSPEELANRYGRKNISKLFEVTSKKFAMETPPGWQSEKHGRGILNIHKLITAPLPCGETDNKETCKVKTEHFLNFAP